MTEAFDRTLHRVAEPRWFEDFALGEHFPIPSRTVTEAHFSAFQAISADNHPIHYDVEHCRERGHRGPLAHGFQILSFTAAGDRGIEVAALDRCRHTQSDCPQPERRACADRRTEDPVAQAASALRLAPSEQGEKFISRSLTDNNPCQIKRLESRDHTSSGNDLREANWPLRKRAGRAWLVRILLICR